MFLLFVLVGCLGLPLVGAVDFSLSDDFEYGYFHGVPNLWGGFNEYYPAYGMTMDNVTVTAVSPITGVYSGEFGFEPYPTTTMNYGSYAATGNMDWSSSSNFTALFKCKFPSVVIDGSSHVDFVFFCLSNITNRYAYAYAYSTSANQIVLYLQWTASGYTLRLKQYDYDYVLYGAGFPSYINYVESGRVYDVAFNVDMVGDKVRVFLDGYGIENNLNTFNGVRLATVVRCGLGAMWAGESEGLTGVFDVDDVWLSGSNDVLADPSPTPVPPTSTPVVVVGADSGFGDFGSGFYWIFIILGACVAFLFGLFALLGDKGNKAVNVLIAVVSLVVFVVVLFAIGVL